MDYLNYKLIHIICATFYFGGGAVSAFYKLRAWNVSNLQILHHIHKSLVLVDYIFIIPTAILLPITGFAMLGDFTPASIPDWVKYGLIYFILSGVFWLPAAWMQIQMQQMIKDAIENNENLSINYYRYSKYWLLLGFPSFLCAILVFYTMIFKMNPW